MSEELKDASITLPKAMLYVLTCFKRGRMSLANVNQMGNICQRDHGHYDDHHVLVSFACDDAGSQATHHMLAWMMGSEC